MAKAPSVAARTKCVASRHSPLSSARETDDREADCRPMVAMATSSDEPPWKSTPEGAVSAGAKSGKLTLTSSTLWSETSSSRSVVPMNE